jgi:hypothetical protein
MLRTSLLAVAATLGLTGFTDVAKADIIIRIGSPAPPPVVVQPVYSSPVVVAPAPVVVTPAPVCGYEVYYRDCPTGAWRVYGRYDRYRHAQDVIVTLHGRGWGTYVRHHH